MLIVRYMYQYLSVFNWTNIQKAICIDNGTSNIYINNIIIIYIMIHVHQVKTDDRYRYLYPVNWDVLDYGSAKTSQYWTKLSE